MKKKKTMRTKICIVLCILFSLIVILIGIYRIQYTSFFHPWHDPISYQNLQEIDEFKEIKIQNDDVNLSGWFWNIQNKETPSPLVIFFVGNSSNSSNLLYNYYLSGNIKEAFKNHNLMIVDYPGYGLSKGKPSDKSMFMASDYIFQYASQMKEVDKNNIVIMGFSIGTGVATYCASQNEANGLILIAPYDNALSLYNDNVNIFYGPLKLLAKYKFDSSTYAKNVSEPVLIFASKEDKIINYKHSLVLSDCFSNLDDIIILEGISHENIFLQSQVLNDISNFLDQSIIP